MATKKKAVKKAKAKKAAKKAVKKATAKKAVKKAVKKAKVKKAVKRAARKPNAAFMKAMTPSAALAVVVGEGGLPRTEVTKKLWAYIKRKNLQDKVNRRMIHADDALRAIFKKDAVNMFEMTKLVNKHLS